MTGRLRTAGAFRTTTGCLQEFLDPGHRGAQVEADEVALGRVVVPSRVAPPCLQLVDQALDGVPLFVKTGVVTARPATPAARCAGRRRPRRRRYAVPPHRAREGMPPRCRGRRLRSAGSSGAPVRGRPMGCAGRAARLRVPGVAAHGRWSDGRPSHRGHVRLERRVYSWATNAPMYSATWSGTSSGERWPVSRGDDFRRGSAPPPRGRTGHRRPPRSRRERRWPRGAGTGCR